MKVLPEVPTMTVTAEEFADRLLQSSLGLIDVLAAYIGDRMGWYRALADGGPATPEELVGRSHGSVRYAKEWLEQQATTGVLTVDTDGRFVLPPGPAEVLTDTDSLSYLAPMARMFGASATQLPALLDAYRNDGGVSWADFGPDMRESQADMNRPWFLYQMPQLLRQRPELDRLRRSGALVADIGCGAGWSSIAIAKTYPNANVEGWDVDAPSIDLARANAVEQGVEERVIFSAADASHLVDNTYDAIFAFECIHDMAQPVQTLADMRRAIRTDGTVIVMDEAVADTFDPPGDDVERLMYGYSLFVCLPDGMSSRPTRATGTVMRHQTLRSYAQEAGFSDVEVVPIEDSFFRFYRLIA